MMQIYIAVRALEKVLFLHPPDHGAPNVLVVGHSLEPALGAAIACKLALRALDDYSNSGHSPLSVNPLFDQDSRCNRFQSATGVLQSRSGDSSIPQAVKDIFFLEVCESELAQE